MNGIVYIFLTALCIQAYSSKRVLTKYSDAASYSTENKRYADNIIASIGQAKIHTLDEMKKLEGVVHNNDLQVKTELAVAKSELTNNMKLHSKILAAKVNDLIQWIHEQFEGIRRHNKEMKLLIGTENTDHANFEKLYHALTDILKNMDPSSTDSNSLGNKVTFMSDNVEAIANAIEQIDKRIPGIDLNGDGISNLFRQHSDSIHLRLDAFSRMESILESVPERLEKIIQRLGDSNYPTNDNHMPTTADVHGCLNRPLPTTTMVAEEEI